MERQEMDEIQEMAHRIMNGRATREDKKTIAFGAILGLISIPLGGALFGCFVGSISYAVGFAAGGYEGAGSYLSCLRISAETGAVFFPVAMLLSSI
jgi:hypothetical protein